MKNERFLMSKQVLSIPAGWHVTYLFDTAGISMQLKSGLGRVPASGLFVALFLLRVGETPVVTAKDPWLPESLAYQVGP